MTDSLQQRLADMEAYLQILWQRSEVQRENSSFTPLSKQPFLKDPVKLRSILERPIASGPLFGKHRAIVTNTKDPLHKGRVQIFCPAIDGATSEENLKWAEVATFFGSLDDQGAVFTPPAGSTVFVEFESGSRESPIVSGAVHNMTRSAAQGNASEEGGLISKEERSLWGGSPGMRTNAKNPNVNPDMKSLMPPWRGESYDGKDMKPNPEGPPPFIYGIKTPQKHFLQFVDGNSKENLKGKRLVMQSSRGSTLFMKDDSINDPEEIFENEFWDDYHDGYPGLIYSARPYNRHKIELKHTGVQLQSVGGGRLIISDETERENNSNAWSAGWSPQGKFRSFVVLESITEHQIQLRDHEESENERSDKDGIFLISAIGNFIGLRDHTDGSKGGDKRGIYLWSTSDHTLDMNDRTVDNDSPRRGQGTVDYHEGQHTPNAKEAYFRLRSGFGQVIEMNDLGDQEDNARQYIIIRNENKEDDEDCPGPPWNFIRMECVINQKQFFSWAAGDYTVSVCKNATRLVWKGNDLVLMKEGSHNTVAEQGQVRHYALGNIIEHSEQGQILMMVGRIIDDELEFPLHNVIIQKNPFVCPYTRHLHYDTPSQHVKASE